MIVLDASAVLDVLLSLPPNAETIRERVRREAPNLLTLHLLDAEVGQVLGRYVRHGAVSAARAQGALEDLRDLPMRRYTHVPLLIRAFALRSNATFYDALYISLAEASRAPLLTSDARLAGVPGHTAIVEVVA